MIFTIPNKLKVSTTRIENRQFFIFTGNEMLKKIYLYKLDFPLTD